MKSSAVIGGSFAPTFQFIKLKIHKVFLRFLNFNLCQNLSPQTLADFISGYMKYTTCLNRRKNIDLAPDLCHNITHVWKGMWYYGKAIGSYCRPAQCGKIHAVQ